MITTRSQNLTVAQKKAIFYKISDIYRLSKVDSDSKTVRKVIKPYDLAKIGVFLYCNVYGAASLSSHYHVAWDLTGLKQYNHKGQELKVAPTDIQRLAKQAKVNVAQNSAKDAFIQLVKKEGSRVADAAKAVGEDRRDYYRYTMRGIYKQYSAKSKIDICREAELNNVSTLEYVCSAGKMIELLQFAKSIVG